LIVKICGAQMRIIHLDLEKNLKNATRFAHEAFKEECNFLIFPELFLTGPPTRNYWMPLQNKYTEYFSNLAREYSMYIVMGTISEISGEKIYNTSILLGEGGDIVGVYRKNWLWANEKTYAKASNKKPVFDTRFGKVGINICWDLAFPQVARTMALKGAKIIFTPSFWTKEDKYGWMLDKEIIEKIPTHDTESLFIDFVVPARAIENEVVYVYVNATGEFNHVKGYKLELFGHSQVAAPFYGPIAKLGSEEKLLVSEVDLGIIEVARRVYQIIEDQAKKSDIVDWEKL